MKSNCKISNFSAKPLPMQEKYLPLRYQLHYELIQNLKKTKSHEKEIHLPHLRVCP
jgi:hypothetical protein